MLDCHRHNVDCLIVIDRMLDCHRHNVDCLIVIDRIHIVIDRM